jgi:hypothetical protein
VRRFQVWLSAVFTALGVLLAAGVVSSQGPPSPPGAAVRPQIVPADRHDVSPALRDLPPIPAIAEGRIPFPPRSVRRGRGRIVPSQVDPVLQTSGSSSFAPVATTNFDGVNNVNSVLPPDTNGDIGPNHYVQWVNLSFAIYSRTGSVLYGPANGKTLWQGFGGPCESRNDGDPIVLYDEHADRWLMSQFALPNFPFGPFYQCIAVSQTGNPTGAYHRYQFSFSKLNDYPKFGVWPDGYYMSINQFTCNIVNCQWAGQGVAAFPRTQMLAGAAASMVYFDMASADGTLGGMLPSDLDGPAPPAGSPTYFAQFDDDAWGYSPDQLQIWEFKVNWASPSNSTFTKKTALGTAAFDSDLCGYARNCIRQAGSSVRLDAISDRVMYRLQYRNFGAYQTLVTNHTVDVNGSDQAGVRWYEIRINNGTPSIHQQGTFAPDTNNRWLASAAMDATGNIAMGYNVSSAQMFPRISFTGRKASDPLGQMNITEGDLIVGTGAQTHSASRWGDYSLLAIDPTDGCTFWFTTEYYSDTTSVDWRTRIGAFQIDGCAGGGGGDPLNAPTNLATTSVTSSQVDLQWSDNSDDETNFHIERCTGSGCTGFGKIGETSQDVKTFTDGPDLAANTYTYRVRAARGDTFSNYSNAVTAIMPPAGPSGLTATAVSSSQINLAWSDNSTNEANFVIERCPGTTATCTSFTDIATLAAGTVGFANTGLTSNTTYTYRVRATNPAGSANSNMAEAKTASTMHVGDLSGIGVKSGSSNWQARVTIHVVDNTGNDVSGATVSGAWSNGYTGSASCTTGTTGTCTVKTSNLRNSRVSSVTFTVNNLKHATLTYNSGANAQTSVVVTKP